MAGILEPMLAQVVAALEDHYQTHLVPLTGGSEAHLFTGVGSNGRNLVFKVYPFHLALLEAQQMRRAGLGHWVAGTLQLQNQGVLITYRFPGQPFTPQQFTPTALTELAQFLASLHRQTEPSLVSQSRLLARLSQFSGTLHDLPQAQTLVSWLLREVPLIRQTPQVFCHRDPHAGNVLLSQDPRSSPQVLLVDWVRAGPDDPARDLAILTTGTLDLLGQEAAHQALHQIVSHYPHPADLWTRLRFWIPLTYLHDMHWFRTKEPEGFEAAVAEKLPKALAYYQGFRSFEG